jgi:phthiocerol/phenolphthiocerol synthesis type-I polyketide synthase E
VIETASNSVTTSSPISADKVTKQLVRIWQELLRVEPIRPDQNYFDLGGDSVLAVQLFAQIERVFKIKLPLATLFDAPTIEELATVLRREAPGSGWSSVVAIQTAGSRPPLFCVHGAGGNVLIYRDLSKQLGSDQPFYGLQSQGLDGQQPLLTRIEEMAARYVQDIQMVQPRGPYYLGGYCMGGTIAFEIAQQLTAKGERVAMVALFDTVNWSKVDVDSILAKLSYQTQRVWFHFRNFLLLDMSDKRRFFVEKLHELRKRVTIWCGFMLSKLVRNQPANRSESLLLARIWKNNDHVAVHYVPRPLNAFIVDFRPLKQYSIFEGSDRKWEKLTLEGHEVVRLPVYPAGMLVEPFVKYLALSLRGAIDEALRKCEGG